MSLQSKWYNTKQAGDVDKKSYEEGIRSAAHTLQILTEILEKELSALEALRTSDYDIPNWSYWQADRNGQIRQLKSILSLTRLDQE